MSTETGRTEIVIQEDPRLVPGIAATVLLSAQRAGLSEAAQEGLAAAVTEAARDTFPMARNHGGGGAELKIIVQDFQDRVEVVIEHSGAALPSAGLDSFCNAPAGGGAGISSSLQDSRVDRVQYETHEGRSRTRLIKYREGIKAKA